MRSAVVIWGSLYLVVGAQNIRGPSEVTTRYGDTLSVTCGYTDGFQSYVKYWCKGEAWKSCAVIIKSGDRSQQRYSIQDYPRERKFTITGRGMRAEDSDTYYCGMERAFYDDMHAVRVTVLPGKCERMRNWGQNIRMYPEKEYYGQDEEVTLTCPAEYHPNYNKIQCIRINGNDIWNVTEVFCIYLPRKCERMRNWGQNISMYPEKEHYVQDEEVTLTCPAEYRPNYSKIQCIRINGTDIWNVTEVFCIYSPKVTPTTPIHSPSWKNIGVSFCFGVIPPMVVKLITILVILVVRVYLKRSTSSVEEGPSEREPDTRVTHSPRRARTNVYHKATEDQRITSDTENDPELIYVNMEADPSCNVYKTT